MGLFSSVFGSNSSSKPPKWAKPYLVKGLEQTQQVFDTQQPRLDTMSNLAQNAFESMAPGAFSDNGFVQGAQDSAQAISSGGLLGANPGQATYGRMMRGGNDPSMSAMGRMAYGDNTNPASKYAEGVAQGSFLNQQPSAGLYGDMMDPRYSTSNPYLESMVNQARNNAMTQTNRLFATRGMGTGISTPYAAAAAGATTNAENALRYQAYNDAEGRRLQAAGQSDNAFGAERSRMDASTGLLGNMADNAANRSLSAAQSLGNQFNAGQDRSLDAAKAADSVQGNQVQQILSAIGMTPGLRSADYAGVDPALSLLNSAATIPWVGVNAYNGGITGLTGKYGTQTSTPSVAGAIGQIAAIASDRRLKTNIERVGEMDDGLGVYEFDYADPARFGEGRFRGVMADEVGELRPWALGPLVDGEYQTVNYGVL